jgi:hypothetical protein
MRRLLDKRTRQRDRVKFWMIEHPEETQLAGSALASGRTRADTPEERRRKRDERFAKWEARIQEAAALRDADDPVGLLHRCLALLSRLEHDERVAYSPEERGFLDALSDYLKEQEVPA